MPLVKMSGDLVAQAVAQVNQQWNRTQCENRYVLSFTGLDAGSIQFLKLLGDALARGFPVCRIIQTAKFREIYFNSLKISGIKWMNGLSYLSLWNINDLSSYIGFKTNDGRLVFGMG